MPTPEELALLSLQGVNDPYQAEREAILASKPGVGQRLAQAGVGIGEAIQSAYGGRPAGLQGQMIRQRQLEKGEQLSDVEQRRREAVSDYITGKKRAFDVGEREAETAARKEEADAMREWETKERKAGETFEAFQLEKKIKDEASKASKAKEDTAKKNARLSQDKVKVLNEGNAIPALLTGIGATIDTNKDIFGPVVGRAAGANPYHTKGQTIRAEMKATSQAFGRFMEGGVLRREDEIKYEKMFPQLSDTPDVAKAKLNVVDSLLRKKQQSLLDAFRTQGYDLTGLDLPAKTEPVPEGEKDTKPSGDKIRTRTNKRTGEVQQLKDGNWITVKPGSAQ